MSVAPLILVVGPSGAGKDSLMEGARHRLAGDSRIHFARRVVTRPALAGAEDHDTLPPDLFDRREAAGGFLLSWRAHGLSYGIPATVEGLRRRGTAVVANVSRAVVEEARVRLQPVGVVVVTAPPSVLADRLCARGREPVEDIRQRLDRAAERMPAGDDVRVVVNDASLEAGVEAFLAALRDLARVKRQNLTATY
ncbi:phosphonate metabolism protein/1,5-bisphosphokinase (PRPP-forming) PhnN [Azospirillum canadense]|uniref:phosphonate metabolism protein/1,5-bisphosphokinase (PRPP-forming) PhnN n=1 Tax=Azospirillum canadense TaxID=403962 RepID=UPI002226E885|nr:phosphonate metabolism protein/1,5-bisphosphokinase (PRPP-forming) PhnN [Azospirillum canadense]MCW2239981.1 phosphonate metabolism protein PhnN/1,5-bisphosphokinase (PRPP-forming) [Azospirillum canadense]